MVELTALSSMSSRAIAIYFFNFYVSRVSTARFFKRRRKVLCLFFRQFIDVSKV